MALDTPHAHRNLPAVLAALTTGIMISAAVLAPWIAPHDPFNLGSLDLNDAFISPLWTEQGIAAYPLGTDDQGRDMLSAILYGMRISLLVGFASVLMAAILGVGLGILAGYIGGWVDGVVMRLADIQLSFPPVLIALLIDGIARTALPGELRSGASVHVVVLAIALSFWVQYARTVRGLTMVERSREYVQAARVIGVHPVRIALLHILPNVLGPVLVIANINLALAIVTEATLSFLGLGVPPTQPSLGTLIRTGNDFLFSGEWWIVVFPGATLTILVLAVNLLGDWLRDELNPKSRCDRF
jgi:peptide/nickel transport system permease protein